eukprot:7936731-Alexandrium_andersonii.AAC.1
MPLSGGVAAPTTPTVDAGAAASEIAPGVPRGELDVAPPRELEFDPWAVDQEPAPEPVVTEPAIPPAEAFAANPAASAETEREVAQAVEERPPLPAW